MVHSHQHSHEKGTTTPLHPQDVYLKYSVPLHIDSVLVPRVHSQLIVTCVFVSRVIIFLLFFYFSSALLGRACKKAFHC
jgi:hypothetical protein